MAEVSISGEYGSEGDDGSSFKHKWPASSEHGSDDSKRQSKYSKVVGSFGEVPGEELFAKSSSFSDCPPVVWLEPFELIDEKEILEGLENDHRVRCQDALKHYRDTKGHDYELVEVVEREEMAIMPVKHFHYNFTAKKKAVYSGGGRASVPTSPLRADEDGSPKLFYADVWDEDYATYRLVSVVQCEILDPSGPVGNCRVCEEDGGVLHPTNLADHNKPSFWVPMDPLPDYLHLLPKLSPYDVTTETDRLGE